MMAATPASSKRRAISSADSSEISAQPYDRTKARPSTFFGDGVVVHMGFADPFCPYVSKLLVEHGRAAGATVHEGGTHVLSLIHISEPTRQAEISYAVF